jgi:hypothetical protein
MKSQLTEIEIANRSKMLQRLATPPEDISAAAEVFLDTGSFEKLGFKSTILGLEGCGIEAVVCLRDNPDAFIDRLHAVCGRDLSCSPQIANCQATNDGYLIVVFDWKGINRSDLLEYDDSIISQEAKGKFYSEISKLTDEGYCHPYAAAGYAHWRIDPRDGAIILLNWEDVIEMHPGNRDEYLNDISHLLQS